MKTETGEFLFCGGEIYNHSSQSFKTGDLLIENGQIQAVGKIDRAGFGGQIIDLKDKHVLPGLIDMHVHLREPGREDEETIVSGCEAAMAGGFTAVCCMPNTSPVIDNRGVVEFVKKQANGLLVDVYPIAAVTKERAGKELTEMSDMRAAGAVAFSDDGVPIANAQILRYGLEYSGMLGLPIIDHCEDPYLTEGKVMNEGIVSTALGFYGSPTVAEDLIVDRDLMLAEYTHAQVHIAHVSSARAVELIRVAKKRGVHVTAEACPHHLVLTDEAIRSFDTNLRVNPPLRAAADVATVIAGLQDGTIDAIASDHAPHSSEEKDVEFNAAAPGMIGLETILGLVLTHLVHKKLLTIEQLVARMAIAPRRILSLPVPEIKPGEAANLTILDLQQNWLVDKNLFHSKSRNTPYHGWQLTGRAVGVFNHGLWYRNKVV